ncbi:hypothetical protein LJC09_00365 [Desulfovibrio sp. OttesenSCG-928-F20]|nr:hypothetical protein [Desulfovibrio sp. OttesenSCG-928-F20]
MGLAPALSPFDSTYKRKFKEKTPGMRRKIEKLTAAINFSKKYVTQRSGLGKETHPSYDVMLRLL